MSNQPYKLTTTSKVVSVLVVAFFIVTGIITLLGEPSQTVTAKPRGMSLEAKQEALHTLTTPIEDYSEIPDFFASDPKFVEALLLLINSNGNRCNSISSISYTGDRAFSIECNIRQYEYQFRDIGGKLDYKVIR